MRFKLFLGIHSMKHYDELRILKYEYQGLYCQNDCQNVIFCIRHKIKGIFFLKYIKPKPRLNIGIAKYIISTYLLKTINCKVLGNKYFMNNVEKAKYDDSLFGYNFSFLCLTKKNYYPLDLKS